MSLLSIGLDTVERGLAPDVITRAAIRQLCQRRRRECDQGDETCECAIAARVCGNDANRANRAGPGNGQ